MNNNQNHNHNHNHRPPLTIMVVEDNQELGEMLREHLELAGHIVVGPIPRISDTFTAILHFNIDCAVLDISLPDGSIIPVAVDLEDRNIPFIFLTGYSELYARDLLLGKRFGRHPLITKPYRIADLLREINIMVGRPMTNGNGNGNETPK